MTIETVPPAIVALAEVVSGIGSAKDPPPEQMDTAILPCVYVFTGEATYTMEASDLYYEDRMYRVQCAVLPKNQATPQTRELRIRPLIRALAAQLISYPQLGALQGVLQSGVEGDSGPAILTEWDGKYLGFEIRMRVRTAVERHYDDP